MRFHVLLRSLSDERQRLTPVLFMETVSSRRVFANNGLANSSAFSYQCSSVKKRPPVFVDV